jgi:hypothetical protein
MLFSQRRLGLWMKIILFCSRTFFWLQSAGFNYSTNQQKSPDILSEKTKSRIHDVILVLERLSARVHYHVQIVSLKRSGVSYGFSSWNVSYVTIFSRQIAAVNGNSIKATLRCPRCVGRKTVAHVRLLQATESGAYGDRKERRLMTSAWWHQSRGRTRSTTEQWFKGAADHMTHKNEVWFW